MSIQTKHTYNCVICDKEYLRKSSFDKHKILCDFKTKSQRERQIEYEEYTDVPTHFELVKIVQELTFKLTKMEESVAQMQSIVNKKKHKLNVIVWLNTNIIPYVGFVEWINTYFVVTTEHIKTLMDSSNTIYYTIQQIFEDNLSNNNDIIHPICCYTQKNNVIYICDKTENDTLEWRQLQINDFKLLLKILYNNLIKEISIWKTQNENEDNDKISILFNKGIIKIMNISFTQDNVMNKIKAGLYNYLKTDLKLIEFEFEF
jgi:hypothetical protein